MSTDPEWIYCCSCEQHVEARLTDGKEIYPSLHGLHHQPFWRCDHCGNYVGCHYKTDNRTRPLGVIPTPQLRKARSHIHALIDPAWQGGLVTRRRLYRKIAKAVGRKQYHTANIKTVEEARDVYRAARSIIQNLKEERRKANAG